MTARRAPRVSARWKPVFFMSAVMLVVSAGLFLTARDGSAQLSAGGLFVAAAALLYVAARNGKPR